MHNKQAKDQPPLDAAAQQHLTAMHERLLDEAGRMQGQIPFDHYMELALYTPGLGYYVNASRKFGRDGDFITAPETSALFSQCLAHQCRQVLDAIGGGDILEFGAGSGVMAADLLAELQRLGCLPARYLLLELSAELRQRQQETLAEKVPDLMGRVDWLDHLPAAGFKGVVLGNELLDAMPVHRFRIDESGLQEQFVAVAEAGLEASWRPASSPGLAETVESIQQDVGPLPVDYESEVNLRLGPWMRAVAERLQQGVILLIDYGYSRREYYHPERGLGTLICHYRHRAHDDAFVLPGLQDITANVDFTAVAEAGVEAGLDVAGFTTQAHFLAASGLDELVMASDPAQMRDHLQLVQGVKTLTLPSEMGERFKVIALSRGVDEALRGFAMRDLRDRL